MSYQFRTLHPSQVVLGTRYRIDNELDDEFLDSVRSKGVIQPISVTPTLELIAGGRRLAAALQLGISEIPAVIREITGELDLRECELIENICRKDLGWLDRTRLVSRVHELMKEKHGDKWGQQKTADMLNRSVGGINRQLMLAKALKQFPALEKCKTEDDAVKLYRKLGEQVLIKHLIKQQEERSSGSESDFDDGTTVLEGDLEGESQTDETPQIPIGVRLARNATNHYRLGDAFQGMKEILDNNLSPPIALVEVDPPYGIDLANVKKGEAAGINSYNEISDKAYPNFLASLCFYLFKVTPAQTRVIFWFGIEWYEEVKKSLLEAGFQVDPIPCAWVKPAGQTASPDNYLARCYETFFVAWKGQPPIRKRGRSNVFAYNGVAAAKKYHPTQRPIELMQEILTTFGWPGSIVLVPFLGSGTTLRAAYTCGMNGFGWDLSEEYRNAFIAQVEMDLGEGLYSTVKGEMS